MSINSSEQIPGHLLAQLKQARQLGWLRQALSHLAPRSEVSWRPSKRISLEDVAYDTGRRDERAYIIDFLLGSNVEDD